MVYEFLAGGLALLVLGAMGIARGATDLFRTAELSPLVVAIAVTALVAIVPQLFVVQAALGRGAGDLALGSVMGADLANLLCVLGVGALVAPLPAPPRVVFREGVVLLFVCLMLLAVTRGGGIPFAAGVALIVLAPLYFALALATEWGRPPVLSFAESLARPQGETRPDLGLVLAALGLMCLYFGARYAIDAAIALERLQPIAEAAIGLAVFGPVLALRDLAVTVRASWRGHAQNAAGQVIAGTIFSLLFVLGLLAVRSPLPVSPAMERLMFYPLMAAGVLVVPPMLLGWRIGRVQGFFLAACYAGWIAYVVLGGKTA